jgi:hypothetical protein
MRVVLGGTRTACTMRILCRGRDGWYFGSAPVEGEIYSSSAADESKTPCCRAFKGMRGEHRVYTKDRGSVEGFLEFPHAVVLGPGTVVEIDQDPAAEPTIVDGLVQSLRFK